MGTIVIKTIKGRRYRYWQRSYRDGGRVRTKSIYIGPVDGGRQRRGILRRLGELIAANRAEPGTRLTNQLIDESEKQRQAHEEAEKRADEAFYSRMHDLYGMVRPVTNPTPIEKAVSPASPAAPAATTTADAAPAPATESPSAEEGASSTDATPSE